ncbi:FAD-dependent tricarballylate dehydrogenase TcuA [Actinomadura syzygii]|uniref:FAD-dependent tricarballylate dehydrogenase TcuA n=1 Tax=Actinomadura syzygii TaxID=1427538 RepID=A0A5D0U5F0_9ACTN|nr:FAD-dependent tricarballylate dehydrogenase TcuA [Actinomadura syzygii]TYC13184.1 FAD-dependent tricarballylate dehydrogenase TcuA [Actinomadura syzygii]
MAEVHRRAPDRPERWDVVVIGGGNAALVSAMSAHDQGARVLVLERADRTFRGGNSRHTRNIRCVHRSADDYNTGAYPYDELWKDLCGVGTGPSDEDLAELTVTESESVPDWMSAHGALWQKPLAGTLHLGRTNRFFLGGGKALINGYYRELERRGIPVWYEAKVESLEFDGPRCNSLVVDVGGKRVTVTATAVVCASGGFEANLDWLREYWGDAVSNYHIRGPRFNDGLVLRQLLDNGAAVAGEQRGFHSVAVDARSPKFDGGIATRIDSIPFGVVLNKKGERFYDEGEDIWPKRYAIWGRNLAGQPDQIGYCVWDSKVQGLFLPPMYGVYKADSIAGVLDAMGLPTEPGRTTIERFNAGAPADAAGRFDPGGLDGVATAGVVPAKTNWAQRIDTPPYYGITVRPGITFTYMGVKVNAGGRVVLEDGSTMENVFAAGEIMSGNVLSSGYLAGFGMTIGTVWGRISGREAARHALR